jgi:lipoyl(octanoyl) transferase
VRALQLHQLGRVEYQDGLTMMRLAADAVRGATPPGTDHLFLLEHPPVLTFGRSADRANLIAAPAWLEQQGFELHQTDRGGDVTYHGPGQVVGYPVIDLTARPDVRRYVAALEEAMLRTCADHGVEAERHGEHRGAWVGTRKIGAVGVHLARWITSHGFAFNLAPELGHFQAIVPCGIADPGQATPPSQLVERQLAAHLATALERRLEPGPEPLRTVSVVPVAADGRVLLLKRAPERGGFWQPVTGRMEPGEASIEAARRELREETGADVAVAPLGYRHGFAYDPATLGRPTGPVRGVIEEAFVARLPPGFEPRLSAEHVEACFQPAEVAARIPRFAGLRRAIRLATEGECPRPS